MLDAPDDVFQYTRASSSGAPGSFRSNAYTETACERSVVRTCGVCGCVALVLLCTTWAFAAFPIASVTDAPPFARTLVWMSIAHHTTTWQEWQAASAPPPSPPTFL